ISIFFLATVAYGAKTYFVATDGNDLTGDGSITAPFATIMKAQNYAIGGDTVYVRGGTYSMTNNNITQNISTGPYAIVNYLTKSGYSTRQRINYWAYPGEKPVFDFSAVKPAGYRVTAFLVTGNYIHIKGLEIIGMQVTILTHTQSECFRNQNGSYNIYEQLSMHDGMGIGFYLQSGSGNLVLNCDAYRNWDTVSETKKGENVDGFGFHPSKGSVGNIIRGCRAWFNSDDGYDCISANETVIFDNCWAFYNGYNTSFASLANGNGFKIGGFGQAPVVSSLPNPIPTHLVKFCMSYRNKANGFYSNHHVETGINYLNNTAYRNATNYNMLSQYITKSAKTGNDTTIDCSGIRHVLQNNVSFKLSSGKDTVNIGTSTNTYNTFSFNSEVTVNGGDFLSLYESELTTPRNEDGSLPSINFLHLKEGSDLIDLGTDLGFPYHGTAPDLGAFEFAPQTSVGQISKENPTFYPNPVKDILHFNDMVQKQVEIINADGKIVQKENTTSEINVSYLQKGFYLIRVKSPKKKLIILKMIKM
ncbi:MAG: right-handed parallel beta-helix repeat-containing protein, partial [Paludibacteraceae bacterium]